MHIVRFDGVKLRELRRGRKWDQHRLAEEARKRATGITQSQISRYENGQEPSGRNAVALASALGVTVESLYASGDADDEESDPMSLDEMLRLRVRQILREEVRGLG